MSKHLNLLSIQVVVCFKCFSYAFYFKKLIAYSNIQSCFNYNKCKWNYICDSITLLIKNNLPAVKYLQSMWHFLDLVKLANLGV